MQTELATMEGEEFKFGSKKAYEAEIQSLIKKIANAKSPKVSLKLEEQYEELLEEYLRFCDNGIPTQ